MSKKVLIVGFFLALSGCGSNGEDSNEPEVLIKGSVSGTVRDYHTGTPLGGVSISVSSHGNADMNVVVTTTSATDGSYQLKGIGISERFLLSADMAQYGEVWNIFANTDNRSDILLSPLVLKAHLNETFDSSVENTLTTEGYDIVTLPANSLVDETGNAFNGQVSTRITLIDPSSDASIMPGDYVAVDEESGETAQIQSFGAVNIEFSDASGNPLQLQQGQSATISIPLAGSINSSNAPQTMPLYYFDESLGYWVEDGEATLLSTPAGYVYQGQVSHFTTWNADMVYETINLIGCVINELGERISGARVIASGRDYIGQSFEYSDESGDFILPVRKNSSALISSISNAQSDTAIIETQDVELTMLSCLELSQGAATITLTWGENPGDLDTHFYGPKVDSLGEFEVYFGNKSEEVAGIVFDLDVDDISSYGPEILTAPDLPLEGSYRYVVDHFSGNSTIKDSPARVELNLAGEVRIFSSVDALGESSNDYWHVFNLEVDANGGTIVQPVQQFSDNDGSSNVEVISLGASVRTVKSFTKLQRKKKRERKYYSVN
jgi:hypothetical protein